MRNNEFNPDWRIHPKESVIELIAEFLSIQSKLSIEEWENLIKGNLKIDKRIAEELGSIFTIPKSFWLNLQKNYDRGEKNGRRKS